MRYWMATENGEADDLVRTGKLLSEAARLAPRDALLRQTLAAWCSGTPNFDMRAPTEEDFCRSIKPVRWQVNDKPLANAPEWAATQRALMARLNAITRWWVRERQLPNGELGGGWSDDVELLRFWGPLALGFGDADATRGIERLADGVWRSPFIENGYNKRIRDVEHAAEPTTDTLPLAVALDPHNQALRARLAQTTACLKHWIARAPDGYWRFRGAWFNCTEFDEHPNRALDVMLNTRAVGPALWQAYLTREPQLIETLARWGEAWTMSMRQTAAGKPAGVFPPAVQFADGNYLVRSSRWWLPDAEWHYFNWSGKNQACVAALLLALHDLTGERRWLDAAGESFAPVLSDSREPKLADELRRYPQAFLEWRRRSGDTRYDQAYQYAPPEADEAKRLTRLRAEMTREARATTQLHAFNFAMYTSEAIFTDRVYYALPLNYQQHLFGGETPRGDRLPMFAVTWPTTQADFARAVVDATNERADLLLYGFAAAEQSIRVRLWKLSPARYRWSLHPVNDRTRTLRAGAFEHRGRAQAHTFTLPARQEVILSISKEVR